GSMYIKLFAITGAAIMLGSCTCNKPYEMRPIQDADKQLSCKEVVLSINEAEQYRKQAMDTRGITADQALLPLCWAPTYFAGQDAIKAADARLEYLGNIYDLLDCGNKAKASARPVPPPPGYRPPGMPPMRQ